MVAMRHFEVVKILCVCGVCVCVLCHLQTSRPTESECIFSSSPLHFFMMSGFILGLSGVLREGCVPQKHLLMNTHLVSHPPTVLSFFYAAQWLLRSAVPCCSYQFERMFNTCRIPGTLKGSGFFSPRRPFFDRKIIIWRDFQVRSPFKKTNFIQSISSSS